MLNSCCEYLLHAASISRLGRQGCALRKIEGSPVLWNCKIWGAQHMICMKNLRFSRRPRSKVRRQGPPGSARAQPWALHVMMEIYQLHVLVGFVDLFVRTPLPSLKLKLKFKKVHIKGYIYLYIYHITEMNLIFVKTVFWGFEFQS